MPASASRSSAFSTGIASFSANSLKNGAENVRSTLGVLLKYQEDVDLVDEATVERTLELVASQK